MQKVSAIYRHFMLEIERRRLQVGITQLQLDDMVGLQDGYYAKLLSPDTRSGRQGRWDTLQWIMELLYPHGFEIIIRAKRAPELSAEELKRRIHIEQKHANKFQKRDFMKSISRKGVEARLRNTPPWKRRQNAREAARARWEKYRAKQLEMENAA